MRALILALLFAPAIAYAIPTQSTHGPTHGGTVYQDSTSCSGGNGGAFIGGAFALGLVSLRRRRS